MSRYRQALQLATGGARTALPSSLANLAADADASPAAQLLQAATVLAQAERCARPLASGSHPPASVAPAETTAEPPPELARLLHGLVCEDPNPWLLREAAELLVRRGEHLPHLQLPLWFELLPKAPPALREAILACAGARGAWLVQLNPAWQRALPSTPEASHWDQGTVDQRLAWFEARRADDPAAARAALQAVWADETPEMREALLGCLSTGLHADDESLLETARTDKRKEVRRTALGLLAALPDSAFVQRMRARVESWLVMQPGGLLRAAKLELRLPEAYDKSWALDGIPEKTTRQHERIGDKANWLVEALSALPPRTVLDRWKLEPESWRKLIEKHEFADALWTGVALAFERSPDPALVPLMAGNMLPALQMRLLQACTQRVREARDIEAWLRPWMDRRAFEPATLLHNLPRLDRAWSQYFLDALRRMIDEHRRAITDGRFHYGHIWSETLPRFSERAHIELLPAWRALLDPLSADPLTARAVAGACDIAAQRVALHAFTPSHRSAAARSA